MSVSNDNQDFGKSDKENETNTKDKSPESDKSAFTSDDLKGKKVDADPEQEGDKPARQS